MDGGITGLLELLDLERVEQGVFVGRPSNDGRSRVYGGHTVGQALAAACFTVDGYVCHSLHATYVRPGIPGRPTHYEVSALRDGSSFATRQVVAVQRDEVVLHMMASFQEPGPSPYNHAFTRPDVAAPETFPPEDERIAKLAAVLPPEVREQVQRKMPFEFIRVNDFDPEPDADRARTRANRQWIRMRDQGVPDDPNFHLCALAYASDAGPLEPCVRAVAATFWDPNVQIASLDHAVWFHRPLRFDDWLLCVHESPSVAYGRAFSRGSVFSRSGELVASIAQEGVVRPRT